MITKPAACAKSYCLNGACWIIFLYLVNFLNCQKLNIFVKLPILFCIFLTSRPKTSNIKWCNDACVCVCEQTWIKGLAFLSVAISVSIAWPHNILCFLPRHQPNVCNHIDSDKVVYKRGIRNKCTSLSMESALHSA